MQHRLAGDWGQPTNCAQCITKEAIFFFSSAVFLAGHIHMPLQMHILISLMLKSSNKALNNLATNRATQYTFLLFILLTYSEVFGWMYMSAYLT